MSTILFEWDDNKSKLNAKRHGISFEEAKTVFMDEYARVIPDQEPSHNEDRFLILGLSYAPRLLVVCHCYRESEEIIRIISARKATRKESKNYEGFLS